MSKKHSAKREAKRRKEEAREAARRKQRQQTLVTVIIIVAVVALGGVVIALSLDDDVEPLADEPTEEPTADPTTDPADELADVTPCEPADAPPEAGEDKPTFDEPFEMALEEGADYQAVIDTSCGQIVVDLYEEQAPVTVNNFVSLAQEGFYDGLEIFRNAGGIFALQTGAGTNDAGWQIGYTFEDELAAAEEEGYSAGSLAMANSGPDTNGSQFFFTYGDSPLPPQYTKFGQVVEGLEVLQSIGVIPTEDPADPASETPSETVHLEAVSIQTGAAADGAEADDAAADDAGADDAGADDAGADDAGADDAETGAGDTTE